MKSREIVRSHRILWQHPGTEICGRHPGTEICGRHPGTATGGQHPGTAICGRHPRVEIVKPAPFGFHTAESVEEALTLLSAYEGSARVHRGGAEPGAHDEHAALRPDALVDLNRIPDLGGVTARPTSVPSAPPCATRRSSGRPSSPSVSPSSPAPSAMSATARCATGDHRGEHRPGDPTGEVPLAAMVLGARGARAGPAGRAQVAVEELYVGPYATVLEPDEMVTGVSFPPAPAGFGFVEMCRRHRDFAVVSVACAGERDAEGRWQRVRIGLGGVADTPVVAGEAGEAPLRRRARPTADRRRGGGGAGGGRSRRRREGVGRVPPAPRPDLRPPGAPDMREGDPAERRSTA